MLFIDDDATQFFVGDIFRDDGMGTHHNARFGPFDFLEWFPLSFAFSSPDKGMQPGIRGFKITFHFSKMLFSQNVCWRHDGRFEAVLGGHQHREDADNGLSTTNVPLNQGITRLPCFIARIFRGVRYFVR